MCGGRYYDEIKTGVEFNLIRMVSDVGRASLNRGGHSIRSNSDYIRVSLLKSAWRDLTMAKKSKDKRYRIIVQVGIWNSTMTRVYRYERQTVLVTAKSAKKALEKACVKGTVLRVVQG